MLGNGQRLLISVVSGVVCTPLELPLHGYCSQQWSLCYQIILTVLVILFVFMQVFYISIKEHD